MTFQDSNLNYFVTSQLSSCCIYRNSVIVPMIMFQFYRELLGDYWDKERIHIENHYNNLKFPFDPATRYVYTCTCSFLNQCVLLSCQPRVTVLSCFVYNS